MVADLQKTMSLVMLARVRATLLLLAASKVLDTPNKVQPHPIRPSKKRSFAVSSSHMVSIQPKPAGLGPHFDMKMPRKVPPPPTSLARFRIQFTRLIWEGFPRQLKRGRPWFAGGTADLAQPEVPGKVRTMKGAGEEFEGFEMFDMIIFVLYLIARCLNDSDVFPKFKTTDFGIHLSTLALAAINLIEDPENSRSEFYGSHSFSPLIAPMRLGVDRKQRGDIRLNGPPPDLDCV
ncbi:hypothetical protein F5877DRAFT_85359 [Lentinula edodes]|nr:hypothetical protein F5877DRAFT_85359 [Lentinula edodes]